MIGERLLGWAFIARQGALNFCAVGLLLAVGATGPRRPRSRRRAACFDPRTAPRLSRQAAGPGANAPVFAQSLETRHALRTPRSLPDLL